jgi:hypothetical protein
LSLKIREKSSRQLERSGVSKFGHAKLWDPGGVDVGFIDQKERWQLIDTASGEL